MEQVYHKRKKAPMWTPSSYASVFTVSAPSILQLFCDQLIKRDAIR